MALHVCFEPAHALGQPPLTAGRLLQMGPWPPQRTHAIEQRVTEGVFGFENFDRTRKRPETMGWNGPPCADRTLEPLDERKQHVFFLPEMTVECGPEEAEELAEAAHVRGPASAGRACLAQELPDSGKLSTKIRVMRVPNMLRQLSKGTNCGIDRHPVNRERGGRARTMGVLLL